MRATLHGVLAFGKDPQRYPQTRNFRIECVAYAGDDRASEILQVANAAGRIDEQVDRATGWFLGLGRFESYRGLVREDRYLLPRVAVREALVNAAVHRGTTRSPARRFSSRSSTVGWTSRAPARCPTI